jgi:tetratricopeptide (TPR) repeat protein
MMKEAMTAYNEAVRLAPLSGRVYNHRGDAYRRLGRYHQALLDYNQAIRLAPQLAEAYAGRAFAYTLLSKDEEAQQDVARAVELGIESALMEGEIEALTKRR